MGLSLKEANKPITFIKGDDFQTFVKQILFPKDKYNLVQITPGYETNMDRFVESSKDPDFKFRSRISGDEFYVEAKYRSIFYRNTVTWCKRYQLDRYTELDKQTPVYIALGVEGQAISPRQVFLFPVRLAPYTKLFRSFLLKFKISPSHSVDIKTLS